jgi:eukaryotic-like serine/threonine-protein kinase
VAAALESPGVPKLIGRYVLYGAIASGGMATVHFGRLVGPAGFARPVAIKRLHAQFAREADFVKMFLDEARLASRVAHPNVVQTLDLVETEDEIFLVMEYVRGLSLSSLVRTLRRAGGRVPPRVAVGIVAGVLEGLHAAHEAKDDMGERLDLVHRDVSPHNVLVGTDGVARLLDFGVAKAAGRLQSTQDGKVKGKIAYMPPEQVAGEPLTRRTDIYAASVVLWEVLTGRRLFYGENDVDSLRRVLNEKVQPPTAVVPDLPPELDAIVLRGLEREAGKRYATAHDMAWELTTCLAPASPTEIGAWVERTAAEELEARASLIAVIERSAAESNSRLTAVASLPGVGAPDAPTPVGRRIVEAPTDVQHQSAVSRTQAVTEPPPRSKSAVVRLVATVAAVVVVAAVVLVLSSRGRARDDEPRSAPLLAPPVVAASSAAPWQPVDTADTAEATPGAEAVAGSPTSPAASAGRSRSPARAIPSTAPATSRATGRPGCDPPFTEDAQGHVHFKPSCL